MRKNANKEPDETIQFSPEQMDLIREGDAFFETGEGFTLAEVRELARKKARTWLREDQSQSA